jgi:hypothetical protein
VSLTFDNPLCAGIDWRDHRLLGRQQIRRGPRQDLDRAERQRIAEERVPSAVGAIRVPVVVLDRPAHHDEEPLAQQRDAPWVVGGEILELALGDLDQRCGMAERHQEAGVYHAHVVIAAKCREMLPLREADGIRTLVPGTFGVEQCPERRERQPL